MSARAMADRDSGLVVISRLHRMVRHGYRPWLGYSTASGEDQEIHLRRRRRVGRARYEDVASIHPDGAVWFVFKVPLAHPRADTKGNLHSEASAIFANDAENFDALFPPDAPSPTRGSLSRWLYQQGY